MEVNFISPSTPSESYLGEKLHIKIDRPLGTKHPKWRFIYPINYGFIPDTLAADGEEIDAYLLGVFEPFFHAMVTS